MSVKNNFDKQIVSENLERLENLNSETQAKWGKMNISQALAHINVGYDMVYGNYKPVTGFKRFIFKLFIKAPVTNEKPFTKNGRTAPNFIISDEKDFQKEKDLLISYINKTAELGESHFEGKENVSFGVLSSKEWSNLFQKHLNHHFEQFGV